MGHWQTGSERTYSTGTWLPGLQRVQPWDARAAVPTAEMRVRTSPRPTRRVYEAFTGFQGPTWTWSPLMMDTNSQK